MGSSLISSHGRKWKGGGPSGENHEWQVGREGPSALDQLRTLQWGVHLPSCPASLHAVPSGGNLGDR